MTSMKPLNFTAPNHAIKHAEKAAETLGNINTNDFGGRISDAIKSVANAQTDSANLTKDFELGRETDLSKVMVQQQVSSLGFQLTLNVRNKLLGAYKDIMNMPV